MKKTNKTRSSLYWVQAATKYTPSPSRNYYPRLIAGTTLPKPKGWIPWLAKVDCTHINLPKVITQLNPKAPEGNETRLSGPRPTQYK